MSQLRFREATNNHEWILRHEREERFLPEGLLNEGLSHAELGLLGWKMAFQDGQRLGQSDAFGFFESEHGGPNQYVIKNKRKNKPRSGAQGGVNDAPALTWLI
jgi:hypothetical protein